MQSDRTMQLIFVDGVGGRNYMRKPLVRFFERQGYSVACFDYRAASEPLEHIKRRLLDALAEMSARGPYVAIGYSFGGVLLRMVLAGNAGSIPNPMRIVLLASPVKGMRLAKALKSWKLYRFLTGEAGQLTASDSQMLAVPWPEVPVACVYGVWPWLGVLGFLAGFRAAHDGMLTAGEATSSLAAASIAVSASHGFIPQNGAALSAASMWLAKGESGSA